MAATLKLIGSRAAAFAALAMIERLLPAIAVGLVAMAHELHPQSARAEAARRARG